MSNWAGSCRH